MARTRDSALQKILQADQIARFRQLALQSQEPFVFLQPDVVSALGISNDQKEKIRSKMEGILMGGGPPSGGLGFGPGPRNDFKGDRKGDFKGERKGDFRMDMGPRDPAGRLDGRGHNPRDDMRKQAVAQIRMLLTNEQREKWQDMTGEPVDLPGPNPFRGGFPGTRGPNGPPPN